MSFVVDTSSIEVLKNYYPGSFPSFWEDFNEAVGAGAIVSVREVQRELGRRVDADHLRDWIAVNSGIFSLPSASEMAAVASILAVPHFQQLINPRAILLGTPAADPWVIARGMILGLTVVTEEKKKPNAAKIPNVCEHFGVSCIDMQGLLVALGMVY